MQLSETLNRKLNSVRKRIAWNRRLKRFAEISCIIAAVAFCYIIVSRFAFLGNDIVIVLIILGTGISAGFIISVFSSASIFQAALLTDRKCRLAERLSTAYSLESIESSRNTGFVSAVLADANKAASGINPERVAPVRLPGAAVVFAIAVITVFSIALIPATYARGKQLEVEKNRAYAQIRIYMNQAGAEISENARNRPGNLKLAQEISETAKNTGQYLDADRLKSLARKVAEARKTLDEKREIIKHFKDSRLLADLAHVLKMGIPDRSREMAGRIGHRLRANPRPDVRKDVQRALKLLLQKLKEDSSLRRNLAAAEASLEAGDISAFEDALEKIGDNFTSDLDEQAVSLAEAVIRAADMKLREAGEPGILVGSPGSGGSIVAAQPRTVPDEFFRMEGAVATVPVETLDIPERFRPVVQKYFARRSK